MQLMNNARAPHPSVFLLDFSVFLFKMCHIFQIISSAAVNMRENTGDGVPEPTLRVLVTKMLEEVKVCVMRCGV